MRAPVFTGACPALVTPFRPGGAVSYDCLAQLLDEQIAAGVDAVCAVGTTGEGATLTPQEHIAVVGFCVRYVAGRLKVIAGAGSNDSAKAAALSQRLEEAGADALLHVTPYYNKTTQAGLIQHYQYIASRTELPIILYNVPSRTGLSFTAETYQALSREPKINGVKEASGDLSLVARTRRLCGDDFYIWSGNDEQTVPMMALGAKGVISVAANIVPGLMVKIAHLCLEGRSAEAAELQLRHGPLLEALSLEVNPIPVKTALELMGREVGGLRLPLCALSPAHREELRSVLEAEGLLPGGKAPLS